MYHIETLTFSLKGGTTRVDLGSKVLLLGPNGSGKSAIVGAIELLFDGAVSDVSGRAQVRAPAELKALAPGRSGELFAVAKLNNGEIFGIGQNDGHDYAQRPDWAEGLNALPLRAVREAILSTADGARRVWLQAAGATLSHNDVLRQLGGPDTPMGTVYQQASVSNPALPVDLVLLLAEQGRTNRLEANRELKTTRTTLERTVSELPPEATDAQLTDAQARVRDLEAALAQAPQASAVKTRTTQEVEAEFGELAAQVVSARSTRDQWVAYRDQLRLAEPVWNAEPIPLPEVPVVSEELHAAGVLSRWHLHTHAQFCIICHHPAAPNFPAVLQDTINQVKQMAATVTSDAAKVQEQVNSLQAQRTREEEAFRTEHATWTQRCNEAEAQVSTLDNWLTSAERRAEELRTEYGTITQAQAQAPVAGPSVVEIQAELGSARQALRRLEDTRTVHASVGPLRRQLGDLEAKVKASALQEDTFKALISTLTASVLEGFVSNVQRYMPKGWSFDIDPDTARPGLWKQPGTGLRWDHCEATADGAVLLTALSGAEWATVTAAMATVVGGSAAPFQVVIPEDRSWDPETLAAAMRGLTKAPQQVIICSTVAPKGKTPAGWTIVEVDKLTLAGAAGGQQQEQREGEEQQQEPAPVAPVVSATSAQVPPAQAPQVPAAPALTLPTPPPLSEMPLTAPGVPTPWDLPLTRSQLEGLGYTEAQIKRMNIVTASRVTKNGIRAEGVSVLNNGNIFQVPPDPGAEVDGVVAAGLPQQQNPDIMAFFRQGQ